MARRAAEVLPLDAVRVGKLLTLADWHKELGRVYRAVRRGEIPSEVGTRLAYMAQTGAKMAEAIQELQELSSLRARLEELEVDAAPLDRLPLLTQTTPTVPTNVVVLPAERDGAE